MLSPAQRLFSKVGRSELFAFLWSRPKRRFSVNEVARGAGLPVATTWRAVNDLVDLGLVLTERIGNALVVQLNERSPATRAMASFVFPDPHRMAHEAFVRRIRKRLPGVETQLFGSVAKGTATPSSDVDVVVAYGETGATKNRVQDVCAQAAIEVLDDFRIVVSPLIVPKLVAIP